MIRKIDRDELLDMTRIPDNKVKVVDVLPENYYNQMHINGAISIPLGKIQKYAPARLNKTDHIVVYCADWECHASSKAAKMLQGMGFENIYEYEAGLADWQQAGLPLEGHGVRQSASTLAVNRPTKNDHILERMIDEGHQ